MGALINASSALCRLWTRTYTLGMPGGQRGARLAEIESDLWEFRNDEVNARQPATFLAAAVLARLITGMPNDLGWRMEHADGHLRVRLRSFVAATAAVFLMTALWLASSLQSGPLPEPPGMMRFVAAPPPPPPPPPPPDNLQQPASAGERARDGTER
jgi:hypothetical protein